MYKAPYTHVLMQAHQEASKQGSKVRRHNVAVRGNRKPVVEYTRGLEESQLQAAQILHAAGTMLSPYKGSVFEK